VGGSGREVWRGAPASGMSLANHGPLYRDASPPHHGFSELVVRNVRITLGEVRITLGEVEAKRLIEQAEPALAEVQTNRSDTYLVGN